MLLCCNKSRFATSSYSYNHTPLVELRSFSPRALDQCQFSATDESTDDTSNMPTTKMSLHYLALTLFTLYIDIL